MKYILYIIRSYVLLRVFEKYFFPFFLIRFKSEAQEITSDLLPILQADFEKQHFFLSRKEWSEFLSRHSAILRLSSFQLLASLFVLSKILPPHL